MPSNPLINDWLKRFMAQHIQSLEQLEILLLLAGDPTRKWTANDLFREIQSNQKSIAHRLKVMCHHGLLESDTQGYYRYKPANQDLEGSIIALQEAYRTSRVKVIEAMFTNQLNSSWTAQDRKILE